VSARFAPKGLVFRPVRDLPAAASIGIALAFHRNAAKAATKRLCEVAVSMARGDL
jgi:hypothetical protein